jgi:hypothetical protein
MATIPSFDQWKQDTYSLLHARSDFLVAVDTAIEAYDKAKSEPAKAALKTAFDRWRFEQSKQGKDWKKSVRNEKGACTSLYRALNDLDKRKLSPEEVEAMRYIAHAQAMALQKQFDGKQLQFKATTLVGIVQGVGSRWERFKGGAKMLPGAAMQGKSIVTGVQNVQKGVNVLGTAGKQGAMNAASAGMGENFAMIRMKVTEFCKTLCPDLDPNKVFAAVGLGSVERFATDLAPFLGALSSGGKAIVGWAGVIKLQWDQYTMEQKRFAIAAGDPEAAFDALLLLVQREITSKAAQASVKTGAFTGKALGVFLDAGAATGPVIGLLEILAEILQTVVEYVRDYRECEAANKALKLGALNLDLFATSPILGCYFLCVQDHSTIIHFAVADYGTPNFVFDAERLIQKIDTVLERSRSFIQASRLEIPGMEKQKGIAEKKGTVATVKDKVMERLDAWFLKPDKTAKLKSRITGYGHQAGGGFGPASK